MSQIKERVSAGVLAPNRLEALIDGVFAIVMTLLVLDITIPEIAQPSLQAELPRRLLELWPKLYSYLLSFIVLGLLWSFHHRSFRYIKRSDNGLIWLNIIFLMFTALIPFSTSLMGNYRIEKLPITIYASNILLTIVMRQIIWTYATGRYRLVDRDINPRLVKADTLRAMGICLTFVLIIGISFINAAVAMTLLVLLLVSGLVTIFTVARS
jgi:uncharacterized membrane protein